MLCPIQTAQRSRSSLHPAAAMFTSMGSGYTFQNSDQHGCVTVISNPDSDLTHWSTNVPFLFHNPVRIPHRRWLSWQLLSYLSSWQLWKRFVGGPSIWVSLIFWAVGRDGTMVTGDEKEYYKVRCQISEDIWQHSGVLLMECNWLRGEGNIGQAPPPRSHCFSLSVLCFMEASHYIQPKCRAGGRGKPTSWRGEHIYIYFLEHVCKEDLFLLPHVCRYSIVCWYHYRLLIICFFGL